MYKRTTLAAGLGVLALLTAGCGNDPADADPDGTSGGDTGSAAVKVAFVTKFPVAFFTAMSDAAKAYESANDDAVDISYFECKTPTDVA